MGQGPSAQRVFRECVFDVSLWDKRLDAISQVTSTHSDGLPSHGTLRFGRKCTFGSLLIAVQNDFASWKQDLHFHRVVMSKANGEPAVVADWSDITKEMRTMPLTMFADQEAAVVVYFYVDTDVDDAGCLLCGLVKSKDLDTERLIAPLQTEVVAAEARSKGATIPSQEKADSVVEDTLPRNSAIVRETTRMQKAYLRNGMAPQSTAVAYSATDFL